MKQAKTKMLEKYLESASPQRRQRVLDITDLINKHYPNLSESLKYKMPTYENADNGGWISIANQKNYVSIYTCAEQHIASFKDLYPKIKTGKGCINIKDGDDFELTDLLPVFESALTTS